MLFSLTFLSKSKYLNLSIMLILFVFESYLISILSYLIGMKILHVYMFILSFICC